MIWQSLTADGLLDDVGRNRIGALRPCDLCVPATSAFRFSMEGF